jgi:hypothetical protein
MMFRQLCIVRKLKTGLLLWLPVFFLVPQAHAQNHVIWQPNTNWGLESPEAAH